MPTPSEQKALVFVAIVILLGGAARIVRAGALAAPQPTPAEQQGLGRQAFAASSTAAAQRSAKGGRQPRGATQRAWRGARAVDTVAGVAGVPFSNVRPGRVPAAPWPAAPATDPLGFPPPNPRIDTDFRPLGVSPAPPVAPGSKRPPPSGPVDLDTASEQEIESLPRVGPALARRLVANRDSLGPFGSLSALRRVRGMGPATLQLLASHVTFSGQARH
jgi:DNA uptake protein ComE-like DNA-binding protein